MRVVRLVYKSSDPRIRTVRVAGTFNEWDPEGVAMERKGDLWTAVMILPRGTYEYMYVEDDARWVTDPLALQTRDDGFGRKNAVLDLTL
jgi:1,4-alpha-glucan branching enzyme